MGRELTDSTDEQQSGNFIRVIHRVPPRRRPIVLSEAQEFIITYRSGSTQTVTATDHRVEGSWISFYDDHGKVLSVPEKDVRSIARAGVEDRTKPPAGSARVRLAR
jgi:hypothetical protein